MAIGAVLVAAGCHESDRVALRIYDPTDQTPSEVTIRDVVSSSVRAARDPGGAGVLYFRLTDAGVRNCHALMRALARRGAREQRPQRFAIVVDGRVRSRPFVDYRVNPNGVDCGAGLELTGLQPDVARRLAKLLRASQRDRATHRVAAVKEEFAFHGLPLARPFPQLRLFGDARAVWAVLAPTRDTSGRIIVLVFADRASARAYAPVSGETTIGFMALRARNVVVTYGHVSRRTRAKLEAAMGALR